MSKKGALQGDGKQKVVRRLPDIRDLQSMESRFFKAIKSYDEGLVSSLLEDEEFKEFIAETDKLSLAFVQVILLNSVDLLKILVSHGVDVQSTDAMFEENGIMHASRYGHKEMLEYLLLCGVSVNHQCDNGSTAMHVAVENKSHGCLEILVQQKGADLNIQDCSGYSPLLWAARLRDWKAMKTLIDAGCNIESRDFQKGITALHMTVDNERAFWKGRKATSDDISQCINLLVDGGLDIDAGDIFGHTPLIYAIKSNNLNAMKHLLKLNCSIEGFSTGANICTPVTYIFKTDVSGTNKSLLPLYVAISKLQLQAVKILCRAGCDYHQLSREPMFIESCSIRPALHTWLSSTLSEPLSLKVLSRNVVKRCLGRNIVKNIKATSLPTCLQEFVCLKDIDEI